MFWGAVFGWVMVTGVQYLVETANHQGPGILIHGGERAPEWEERVSEKEYKRHHYSQAALWLGFGLCLWFLLAWLEKIAAAEIRAKEEYLKAHRDERIAYLNAFASALDQSSLEQASARALSSPEYQAAAKALNAASHAHWRASKALKGED